MSSPHYSLRWNNHQSHLLTAFDSLLQNETLVDVTLVCEESTFKAHKVVLSACSPYFQRIFSETPCKHPVIVLKDLRGWEVQAIVDFMYRGEISVGQEQLSSLIKAAESLQVRGLAHTERIPVLPSEKREPQNQQRCYSPTTTPPHHQQFNGPQPHQHPHQNPPHSMRLPQIPHLPNISFSEMPERHCTSPMPRRKQARPRRRSGDTGGPQDLSKAPNSPPRLSDMAENLSLKKNNNNNNNSSNNNNNPPSRQSSTPTPPGGNMKMESEDSNPADSSQSHPVELTTTPQEQRMSDYSDHLNHPTPHHESLENSFPHLASISALSLTPPHMFSLDSQLGLFPGMENCRNPLLGDLNEPRFENHISTKKKMGRPKGQHSAPRGGPPRSWTNAELTEALQHVWNKKMTTSQASRIFGIPYNSLLMYVRGKYGKSLKLEQLKKECFGELGGSPLDLLGLGNIASNNNNPPMGGGGGHNQSKQAGTKLPPDPPPPEHLMMPGFNPAAYPPVPANFYPDFASFPIPVGMVHLLPQSEKNREPPPTSVASVMDAVDYTKGDPSENRRDSSPLDFATKEEHLRNSASPMTALDFVKEETPGGHQNHQGDLGSTASMDCHQPQQIPVGQSHNGQD
ncbi:helix-turn-helix, Psq domain [Nesidiocoris tenuis]|uniref:Helix-turn-helix, Psq domain n=1 Tax=Nesidiocoris tenuis TaxID=355587 RepID=A0ABN7A9C6_9HEMI|nr:helix-turn-helix, Psq domain [Nesidiocoris tenuis]